jgi:hypothetical protein
MSHTHPPAETAVPGFRFVQAGELYAAIPEIAQDIQTAPKPGESCLDLARRLHAGATPEEAITAMAFALSPRHAIWWGHECLKALPDLLTGPDLDLMALCAAWVAEPEEANRYACLNAASVAQPRGPGAWLAMAAGWAAGSMTQEGLPPVAAPGFALGRGVNAAVLTALARVPQAKRNRMLDHYVNMAEILAKNA